MEDKEIINTDDYFYEITDEGRGTIGYGCVSYKTTELIKRILKQNKQLKRLEQENEKFINVTNDSIIEQEKQVARINCLEQENEQLEKENKVNLSRSLDLNRELQNLSAENAELKAENERLKEEKTELEEKFLTLNGKSYSYYTTLQEIKAIADAPKPFIDFSETKTTIEVEYDYAAICNELELRLHKVLELIIKAEEE